MYATSTAQWCIKDGKAPGAGHLPDLGQAAGEAAPALLRKVLVVDDEAELADLAAILLGAHGLEVLTAYSAKDALRLLGADNGIDAVVSDVRMPGMTGLELGDAIREIYPRVKVVLVSGFTLPEQLADRERPYLFATKPYDIETLLKLLHS